MIPRGLVNRLDGEIGNTGVLGGSRGRAPGPGPGASSLGTGRWGRWKLNRTLVVVIDPVARRAVGTPVIIHRIVVLVGCRANQSTFTGVLGVVHPPYRAHGITLPGSGVPDIARPTGGGRGGGDRDSTAVVRVHGEPGGAIHTSETHLVIEELGFGRAAEVTGTGVDGVVHPPVGADTLTSGLGGLEPGRAGGRWGGRPRDTRIVRPTVDLSGGTRDTLDGILIVDGVGPGTDGGTEVVRGVVLIVIRAFRYTLDTGIVQEVAHGARGTRLADITTID
jgi:hypothetical protein